MLSPDELLRRRRRQRHTSGVNPRSELGRRTGIQHHAKWLSLLTRAVAGAGSTTLPRSVAVSAGRPSLRLSGSPRDPDPNPEPVTAESRPLRVAHVTTAHPARDNRIFRKECIALAEAGFDVHLVAVNDRDDQWADVSIDALPKHSTRLGRALRGPVDAWIKLGQIQPSIIHVHDPELIPMAILWKRRHRRPAPIRRT